MSLSRPRAQSWVPARPRAPSVVAPPPTVPLPPSPAIVIQDPAPAKPDAALTGWLQKLDAPALAMVAIEGRKDARVTNAFVCQLAAWMLLGESVAYVSRSSPRVLTALTAKARSECALATMVPGDVDSLAQRFTLASGATWTAAKTLEQMTVDCGGHVDAIVLDYEFRTVEAAVRFMYTPEAIVFLVDGCRVIVTLALTTPAVIAGTLSPRHQRTETRGRVDRVVAAFGNPDVSVFYTEYGGSDGDGDGNDDSDGDDADESQ